MAHTPGLRIVRAWRFKSEPTRIHYILLSEKQGIDRHLKTDEGSALYDFLAAELDDQPPEEELDEKQDPTS